MPTDILLVEDNQGDIRLMREILGEINPTARLHVVTDGVEAMEFLGYQGRCLDAPRPDVILLDLNLPKLHGREVLARIKANPHLETIPVIVLNTSDAESDVVSSYELKVNSYLKKPGDLSEFEGLEKSLNDFWLTRVKLPKHKQTVGPL
ncbi:MAG TPA: response regulator [Terriglobales bacterium]|nr:response regulator [Terriglobales bacterium]